MIPISGCHRCSPKEWRPTGPSVGEYFCTKCKNKVTQVLEKPVWRRKEEKNKMDPVHEEDGVWYYWIETWADRHGPFKTEGEARIGLNRYCEFLDSAGEEEKDDLRSKSIHPF